MHRKLNYWFALIINLHVPCVLFGMTSDSIPADSNLLLPDAHLKISEIEIGHTLHPLQLVRGKVAGLDITHPGSNPFDPYIVRSRGIHTFSLENASPFFLLNDMPIENLHFISPWEIQSIEASIDAATSSRYGFKGQQGVINFRTVEAGREGWSIQYNNIFALESIDRQVPVANAEEFVSYGGEDLGESRDWQKEITRKGFSQLQRLAVTRRWKNTAVMASGQWRDILPVLKNTESNNLYGHITLNQTLWENRIRLTGRSYFYGNRSQFGEPQAFQFANKSNPTSPLYNSSDDTFAGYFEQLKFNYFNPVSIIDQIRSTGKENGQLLQFSGSIDLFRNTWIEAKYGSERASESYRRSAPATSRFEGHSQNGVVSTSDIKFHNEWADLQLAYKTQIEMLQIKGKIGFDHQEVTSNSIVFRGTDFSLPVTTATPVTSGENLSTVKGSSAYRLVNYYGKVDLDYKQLVLLNFQLTRSGSSRLGAHNPFGWFYGIRTGLNINKMLKRTSADDWSLHFSVGSAGAQPPGDNLSVYVVDPQLSFYYNGNYIPQAAYRHDRNPDLKWEQRNEWELSMHKSYWNRRLTIGFLIFRGQAKDIITLENRPSPPSLTFQRWENMVATRNKGWQLWAKADVMNTANFTWQINLQSSRSKSVLEKFPPLNRIIGGGCGCGGSTLSPIVLTEGTPLDRIRTWRTIYSVEERRYREVDRNGDGTIWIEDMEKSGNAFPTWQLGLNNSFRWNKFEAFVQFGGSFGHSLIHVNRLNYEVRGNVAYQNIIQTKYFENKPNDVNVFSDMFVEKATYLQLEQLNFSYDIGNLLPGFFKDSKIYLGGSNVMTLTQYSGSDPQVRYQNVDYQFDGSPRSSTNLASTVASGVDSEYTYPFTRSWYLGLKITF